MFNNQTYMDESKIKNLYLLQTQFMIVNMRGCVFHI